MLLRHDTTFIQTFHASMTLSVGIHNHCLLDSLIFL